MEEGNEIEAFCDPENPDQVELYYDVDGHYNEIVIIAIFFIICGALPMVFTLFKMRRK